MSLFHGAYKTVCPFYKDETKNSLSCEGIFGCNCTHTFMTAEDKKRHKKLFCDAFDYKDCILYQGVIENKY